MTTTPQPDMAQIRKKLDIAFDDSSLSAFCLDYFPKVYDRFSQGMRKDDKITLLLDDCRRQPTGFETFRDHVRKEYSYAKRAESGKMSTLQGEQLKPLLDALEVYVGSLLRITGTTKGEMGSGSDHTHGSRPAQMEAKVRERRRVTISDHGKFIPERWTPSHNSLPATQGEIMKRLKKLTFAQSSVLVLALLTVIIPIMINYATASPPWWIKDYPWLPWAILAVLTCVLLLLTYQVQNKPSDEPKRVYPSSPYLVSVPIKEPEHFFGRKKEVQQFFSRINAPQPQPLQVLGLRRAGKTSFLHYVSHAKIVHQKAREPARTLFIYLNLETGIKTVPNFYQKLAEGINRRLPKGNHIPLPTKGSFTIDAFSKWLDSPALADYRLIILLDEFEALRKQTAFEPEFFKELRGLVINHLGRLAWVTCSYIDLFRLTRLQGEDEKTSPFFNIFHPTPIILASLTPSEADELIQMPATAYQVSFDSDELWSIQQLAGRLPFFLQMAAEAWFEAKRQGKNDFDEIKTKVKQKLTTDMGQHFESYWRIFEQDERALLTRIATQTPTKWSAYRLPNGKQFVAHFLSYGIITKEKGDYPYRIAGEVFAEWIRRRTERPSP